VLSGREIEDHRGCRQRTRGDLEASPDYHPLENPGRGRLLGGPTRTVVAARAGGGRIDWREAPSKHG